VERLSRGVPHLTALAAVRAFPAQAHYQQRRVQARLVGTESDYMTSANLTLRSGRFLTLADENGMQRVCVLGDDVRQALFAFQNPIGEMVKIRDDWFRVVGVLENKELHPDKLPSIHIHNVNADVYIPLSTSQIFAAPQEMRMLTEISLRIDTPENMEQVARIIRTILVREHHGADDYEVIVPRELLQQSQQTQQVFNLVMGSIAGISLLVGGIGIMNIMLATVTERTREIGIRRAIGASRRMILLQFLVETILLTFVGGILGILLGIGGAAVISLFAEWRTIISWQTVALAFGISAMIGLVFGLYPASQGANMNPISALRYE
jgi:putative ABC transport system permease protein